MDALIGQKGVKYGLQVRKPEKKDAKKTAPPKPSIFGDDASDDEEDNVERQIARHAARKQNDRKVRSAEWPSNQNELNFNISQFTRSSFLPDPLSQLT